MHTIARVSLRGGAADWEEERLFLEHLLFTTDRVHQSRRLSSSD
jgi:hypothetical protein